MASLAHVGTKSVLQAEFRLILHTLLRYLNRHPSQRVPNHSISIMDSQCGLSYLGSQSGLTTHKIHGSVHCLAEFHQAMIGRI